MDLEHFKKTLSDKNPPTGIDANLKALWYDGKGHWDEAHNIVQASGNQIADWIHAYLHRKEGDLGNASYWYSRARKQNPNLPIDAEWEELVKYLLSKK